MRVPGSEILLVLAIREGGSRSALAGKLTIRGANVLTSGEIDDNGHVPGVLQPAVLVIDEATRASRSAKFIKALLAAPHWSRVVVVHPSGSEIDPDPRLVHIEERDAASRLLALIPEWQAEAANA